MSQRNRLRNDEQNREFFTNLPPETILEILSRLPCLTVLSCKCVCKSWLHLLETDDFMKSHLSKAVPALAVQDQDSCTIFEFVDLLNLEEHELHYEPVAEFSFISYGLIRGSANGLLFQCNQSLDSEEPDQLYVYNPITFEYIEIICPQEFGYTDHQVATYGFGASTNTGQLKVVRIFHDCVRHQETKKLLSIPQSDCHVYTLGKGSWRCITPCPVYEYNGYSFGAFSYGNLHWLVFDLNDCPFISCFDLEHELFTTFQCPPLAGRCKHLLGLYALEDCLCLSDSSSDDEFVIWLMKEKDYGVEKSWRKELVVPKIRIPNFFRPNFHVVRPIKFFRVGDVLMIWGEISFFYYSSKAKTSHQIYIFERYRFVEPILHISSLFSLKSFVNEKVGSFGY